MGVSNGQVAQTAMQPPMWPFNQGPVGQFHRIFLYFAFSQKIKDLNREQESAFFFENSVVIKDLIRE